MLEIAQRAKKLLRSWQGLLNTSQANEHHSSSLSNGDGKPRLILKVKLNSPLSKRKHEQGEHLSNGTNAKRRKSQVVPVSSSILPRLKTTQQLLMDMQLHEQRLLPTSMVDETVHRGHELNPLTNQSVTNEKTHKASIVSSSSIHRENSLPTLNVANYLHPIAGPTLSLKPVVKRLSSSFIASTTNCEPPVIAPAVPKKKRRKKSETPALPSSTVETSPPDVASMCASYSTVADLVADHRRRMTVKHDLRELEARPDLLLVPIDQLAIVYERERTRESLLSAQACSSSMTTVEKLRQSTDLIALPFIDCPLEFDFLLDELVVQQL